MALNLKRIADRLRRTPLHPQWLIGNPDQVVRLISTVATGSVLDVGCASRWIENHLPEECRYTAIDYPATGGELYGARPSVFCDAGSLPFCENSFNTVIALEVLEHLKAPSAAIQEIARVLKPGGHAVITIPFLYPVHDAPHDYQRYTVFGLIRETNAAGLVVESERETLSSLETAGLISSLAIGGACLTALKERRLAVLLLPLLALAILTINLTAWVAARILPSWPALTAGYELVLKKPWPPL